MTDINSLSSEELYRLFEERKKQEETHRMESMKHEIQAVKEKIKALDAQYKKDRAELEAQLAQFGLKPRSKRGSASSRNEGISDRVLEIIQAHGEISTKEINKILDAEGKKPKNLSQSMTYLKKRNQVIATGRGLYKLIQNPS
jgi:hypothetical protein